MNKEFFEDIFIQSQDFHNGCEEPSFLDLSEMFDQQLNEPVHLFSLIEDSAPLFDDRHAEESVQLRAEQKEETFLGQIQNSSTLPPKVTFKSSYNKNVCYNICQKTVKVIKKGLYEDKLQELCNHFDMEIQKFKAELIRRKKDFTGPKALAAYIEENSKASNIYRAFMKWFLAEKYLRMALNEGEMKDIKAYIEYKNQIILPLLE